MKKINKILLYSFITLISLSAIFFTTGYLIKNKIVQKIAEERGGINQEKTGSEGGDLFIVRGEISCLPLKTDILGYEDSCVLAIEEDVSGIYDNDESVYYQLKAAADNSKILSNLHRGQEVEVKGKYLDELSDKYEKLGSIEISSLRFLDREADYEYELPKSFKADFVSFSDYKLEEVDIEDLNLPGIRAINGEIDCDETSSDNSSPLEISKKEINGRKYCIMSFSEGSAGSIDSEYLYSTIIDDDVYLLEFVARYTNCGNYPEEKRLECEKERSALNLDRLVDKEISKNKFDLF